MKIRRVVTGHDEAGKAVFVDDREVAPITVSLAPGAEYHRLWGGNEAPSFPDDGARGAPSRSSRPSAATASSPSRSRRGPPGGAAAVPSAEDIEAGLAENDNLPGPRDGLEPDAPGMQ